jgi:hypothetical protein
MMVAMISGGFSSVVCFAIAYPDPRQSFFQPRYTPLSTLLVLFMVLAARQGRESSLRRIRDVMLLENVFLLAIVRCWHIPSPILTYLTSQADKGMLQFSYNRCHFDRPFSGEYSPNLLFTF